MRQQQLERDLHLTNQSLKQNPKNYSAWEHRKWVLATMPDADWDMEMSMVDLYLKKDARNCELPLSSPSRPLLTPSSKVHSWNYRRYLIHVMRSLDSSASDSAPKITKLPSTASEIAFTRTKISDSFSNFSAWHYRTRLLPRFWEEQGWVEGNDERREMVDEGEELLVTPF